LASLVWGGLCACAAPLAAVAPEETALSESDLPSDLFALHAIADEDLQNTLPLPSALKRADMALEKAVGMEATVGFETLWRLSRLNFCKSNMSKSKDERRDLAQKGAVFAAQAHELEPKRVEAHYFSALNLALVAEATADKNRVKAMMDAGKRAADIDPGFDDAGPLRFLGKVYITAPGWPTSVGSTEKGVETLERAVAIAPSFLNRLFLAEAYYHDEQTERALELFRKLQNSHDLPAVPARWQEELENYVRLLDSDMEDSEAPEL